MSRYHAPPIPTPRWRAALLAVLALAGGCRNGLDRLDQEVAALLLETNDAVGATVAPDAPPVASPAASTSRRALDDDWRDRPSTVNPAAADLEYPAAGGTDAESVIARLDAYAHPPVGAERLDLAAALARATRHAREHRFAEEDYLIRALRLLTERHRWGPRFFDEVSATVTGDADGGSYDTALQLVNELRLTQRLPYGGEVSARALANATEDLHRRVTGEGVQTADLILDARIPLLRGGGRIARADRVQAERDMVYAARTFARFRRRFLFDVASDYLDLVVAIRQIENAERGVESFRQLEVQQEALYRAGRATPFDTAEAKNETLEAVDRLNSARESYRLALDRFKARIGVPVDQPLVIEIDGLDLAVPVVDLDVAVASALERRLDLQNRADAMADARRAVEVARNDLLGTLDVTASLTVPTDPARDRAGLRFDEEEAIFRAGVTYGVPLDREIERLALRERQIGLDRAPRSYDQFRDDVTIAVRAAVRGIDAAAFSLRIQEENVRIAARREASIRADPARADVRQKTDAINQTARARDGRDRARRDLDVAILRYLLETGQLRVAPDGTVIRLPGMIRSDDGVDPDDSDA